MGVTERVPEVLSIKVFAALNSWREHFDAFRLANDVVFGVVQAAGALYSCW
jgi:hypothetical protein